MALPLLVLASTLSVVVAQDPEPICRSPYETAELVEVVAAQWDQWAVDSLVAFWPVALETVDSPPTDDELPTMLGRYVGEYGRCAEVFTFTRARKGTPQYLASLELRYAADTFDEVASAGKTYLRSFGKPFDFLGDAYDEWRPDDEGWFRRDYRWDSPSIHLGIEVDERDGEFHLSMHYERETVLDRPAPELPETPFRIALIVSDPDQDVAFQRPCGYRQPTGNVEPGASARLFELMRTSLAERDRWFELVRESEADYIAVVGAVWSDTERCAGFAIELPGLHLGLSFNESAPNWRDLDSLEESAPKLAEGLEEQFREHYWRFLQFQP